MPAASSTNSAPAARLRFDQVAHRYWLGERELPSVTTVLKGVGLINTDWFTEDARRRGEFVHRALEWRDRDELDPASVDPSLKPYVDGYELFLRESGARWSCVEQRLGDDTLGYAGTVDRIGTIGDERVVLDLKTGPPQPWHALQLAAYHALIRPLLGAAIRPHQVLRYGLYLKPDGTYRLQAYRERSDLAIFRAALAVAQFKETHGISDSAPAH